MRNATRYLVLKRSFLGAAVALLMAFAAPTRAAENHLGFGVGGTYLVSNGTVLYGQAVTGTFGGPNLSLVGTWGIDWAQLRGYLEIQTFFGRTSTTNLYALYGSTLIVPTLKLGPVYFGPGIGVGDAVIFGPLGLTSPFHFWLSATLGLQFGRFFIEGRAQVPTYLTNMFSAVYSVAQLGFFFK